MKTLRRRSNYNITPQTGPNMPVSTRHEGDAVEEHVSWNQEDNHVNAANK